MKTELDKSMMFLLYFVSGTWMVLLSTMLFYYLVLPNTIVSVGVGIIISGTILSVVIRRAENSINNIKNQNTI